MSCWSARQRNRIHTVGARMTFACSHAEEFVVCDVCGCDWDCGMVVLGPPPFENDPPPPPPPSLTPTPPRPPSNMSKLLMDGYLSQDRVQALCLARHPGNHPVMDIDPCQVHHDQVPNVHVVVVTILGNRDRAQEVVYYRTTVVSLVLILLQTDGVWRCIRFRLTYFDFHLEELGSLSWHGAHSSWH
jgi:hypothetical protein